MRQAQWNTGDSWSRVVRAVLVLLVLVIALAPITQNVWTNDNFMHGHDTETTITLGLTLVSLLLLLIKRSQDAINQALVHLRAHLSSLFDLGTLFHPQLFKGLRTSVSARHNRGKPGNQTGYELPLLI